jgi:hypothetical protein
MNHDRDIPVLCPPLRPIRPFSTYAGNDRHDHAVLNLKVAPAGTAGDLCCHRRCHRLSSFRLLASPFFPVLTAVHFGRAHA